MKNIITAINNPELNNEIKKEKNLKIINKDIIYKEGIIEILEEKKEINLIIINYDLPGKIEIEDLVNKIKKINEKIELIFILEKEDIEKEQKLKKLNIKNIYYNNEINKEKLIQIIKKENKNKEEELQKEIRELKKIIEENKKENKSRKIKNKIEKKVENKIEKNLLKKRTKKTEKKDNKIKNAIIINENEKKEGSFIIKKLATKAIKKNKKILIININLENKIIQDIFNKKNIEKIIDKKIKYIENSKQKNINKKIENALFVKINENIKLITGLKYYKNKNEEYYINKIINIIQKNSKKYYLIIIYFLNKKENVELKKELNKKIEKNIFIISNNYIEIKELKKELRKYNFLENKNTYIFLKKENNNKNNTINSSIIKNIFKKEKITTKLKIIK
ncbi:MAG: hypothetical protein BHW01_03960 [Clostridium sp. 27_14]|nr:MAG: hypothetical protein BHW01_03960 [Clostridium sp. 27_14]